MRCFVSVLLLVAAAAVPQVYGATYPLSPAERAAALNGGYGPLGARARLGGLPAAGLRGGYVGGYGPLGAPLRRPFNRFNADFPLRGAFSEPAARRYLNQGNPLNLRSDGFVDGPSRPYSFAYGIDEPEYGNNYGHTEQSDGVVTQGEYQVLLPDGRNQVVTYSVEGNSGFQAAVRYEK